MPRASVLLALLLLTLALSSCAERMHSEKALVEWSRGRKLGVASQSEPPALAVAPDGARIALVWHTSPQRDVTKLHLVTLDRRGAVQADLDLPLEVTEPTALRLAMTGDGHLHLTWVDTSEDLSSLLYAILAPDGQLIRPPQRLSSPGFRVSGHQLAALSSGQLLVVWTDREGLTAARVGADGTLVASEAVQATQAALPSLQLDDTGLAHLAWQQSFSVIERRLMYATLDPASLAFSWPIYLDTVVLSPDERLQGPVLALQPERLVATWSVGEVQGSRDNAFYLTFVPGEMRELSRRRVAVPSPYPPDYEGTDGPWPYVQLAAPLPGTAVAYRASTRSTPATTSGLVDEVPLALSLWVQTSWSPRLQPALVLLDDGKVRGYQVVGWTWQPSLHPTLATDAQRELYLAWLDAAGKTFPVYLAGTSPFLQESWDRATGTDLVVALERLFGRVVSSMGLIFVAFSWILLPGFFLIFALFVFREDSLDTTRGWVVLLLLIAFHWAGKYLLAPELLTELPRLSDLPLIFPLLPLLFPDRLAYLPNQLHMPAFVAPLVPLILPGLTLLAGISAARLLYLRRRKYANLVLAYLILAVVDLFLSLQIYALGYFDPAQF